MRKQITDPSAPSNSTFAAFRSANIPDTSERRNIFKTTLQRFNVRGLSGFKRPSVLSSTKRVLSCYAPLAEDQIRLLEVRNKKGHVSYDLVRVRLDEAPPYTALSYCWEDQTPDQPLSCSGTILLVTANVTNFLHYCSISKETQYIWIDAVCINQIDVIEKNHQVSFMKSIYTKATMVVIWLGESEDSIDEAIRKMPEVLPLAGSYNGTKEGFEEALKGYGIPVRGSLFWEGVEALLSKPWFYRLWTFQEAVLPHTMELRCGSNVMTYDLITKFVKSISADESPLSIFRDQRPSGLKFQPLGRRTWARIDHCRNLRAGNVDRSISFSMLLIYSRNLQASKPADKIYGMLGLAEPWLRDLISVDYERSHQEVFFDFTKQFLAAGGESRLLNMFGGHTEGLPTWCPDFAAYARYVSIANFLGCTFRAGHSAEIAKDPVSSGFQLDNTVDNPRQLGLRGFLLDTIELRVSYPGRRGAFDLDDPLCRDDKYSKVIEWEAICFTISSSASQTSRSNFGRPYDIRDAHLRTLTAGSAKSGAPQDDNYELLMSYMMMKYGNESHQQRYRDISTLDDRQRTHARHLLRILNSVCHDRSFILTKNGRIGLAHAGTRQGDRVCILYGGLTPFIVRPTEQNPSHFKLIGEAYVDGVMFGEALELEESTTAQTLTLV